MHERAGVTLPQGMHGKRLTSQQKKEFVEAVTPAYLNGASLQQLADETGRSTTSIGDLLKAAGVKLRPRGKRAARPTRVPSATARAATRGTTNPASQPGDVRD